MHKIVITIIVWAVFVYRVIYLIAVATYGIRTGHPLDSQASHIRWLISSMGAVLFWIGAETRLFDLHSYIQFGAIGTGSLLMLLFILVPDASYFVSRGVNRLRGIPNPPDSMEHVR